MYFLETGENYWQGNVISPIIHINGTSMGHCWPLEILELMLARPHDTSKSPFRNFLDYLLPCHDDIGLGPHMKMRKLLSRLRDPYFAYANFE